MSDDITDTLDALHRADVALSLEAGQLRHDPAVRAAGFLSEISDQPPAFALAAATVAAGLAGGRPRLAEAGARVFAALALTTWAKSAIKARVTRTRPYKTLEEGEYRAQVGGPDQSDYNSFPSGHTGNAFTAARAVGRVYPDAAMPALGLAAMVGAVQVPRASHHAADVIAGAAVGIAAEAVVNAAFAALREGWGEREGNGPRRNRSAGRSAR